MQAAPIKADYAFFWPYRVRYRDIDPQGVVYFPKYLEIVNGIVHEYFRWLGFPYRLGADPVRGDDFHIVRAAVDYLAPICFDEEIEVGVRASRVGRTSLTTEAAIFGAAAGDPRARAEIVWVNTDQASHRPAPLPADLAQAIRDKDIRAAAPEGRQA
jgi:acyl-CoA thioester hydrolase